MSNFHSTPAQRPPRPPTIATLASRALTNLYDPSKDLKSYLRLAQKLRADAAQLQLDGDYEDAFVRYAKAATLVMEYLPGHREYKRLLSEEQRENLTANGVDIMAKMAEIKPILEQRIVDWDNAYSQIVIPPLSSVPPPPSNTAPAASPTTPTRGVRFGEARFGHGAEAAHQELEWRRMQQLAISDDPGTSLKKAAAAAAALKAASAGEDELRRRQRAQEDEERARRLRAQEEERARHARQQEEMRLREEEIRMRRRKEKEAGAGAGAGAQEGRDRGEEIRRRQVEANEAARAVRHNIEVNNPGVIAPQEEFTISEPVRLPLAPPSSNAGTWYPSAPESPAGQRKNPIEYPTPLRSGPPSFPTPITTSALPPAQARIQYPQLMNPHQQVQGYHPSLDYPGLTTQGMGPRPMPPTPTPVPPRPAFPYPAPAPTPTPVPAPVQYSTAAPSSSSVSYAAPPHPGPSTTSSTGTGTRSKDGLRQIHLPRSSLHRFTAIAAPNTALNLETCGLLLGREGDEGKEGNGRYVVTVLLVPKQHATSDTCTMDEEELVLKFTEERGLITLGWIHTHPTQSCFMSSVDLHTHAGFQCMLPESFAVVCAPRSNPSFGIFRLTDPPGLSLVLDCTAKEAFHPHPDRPIYTDADKGHVQMRELPLEIVDIR